MSHQPSRRAGRAWLAVAALALVALVGLAALATAKTSKKPKQKPLVAAARNASQHATIVVDGRGLTLYELSPETSKHLLCTSSQCLQFWPPATVGAHAKLVKGTGVKGTLGRLHRSGFDQLTLDGRPLYRFGGDTGKGSAAGQGIVSFGGTWHVVKAAGGRTTTSTTTSTSTSTSASTSTSTTSTYSYPGY